jgi:protein-tyrosine kinase
MSKIHQAIRKLENKSPESSQRLSTQREILEDITKFISPLPRNDQEQAKPEQSQEGHLFEIAEDHRSIKLSAYSNSHLVALSSPKSLPSEQYRALRTKIFHMQQERELKSLLITSAGISDGKTLTAINLALTMALEIDCKVLLIEGDLRRPSFQKYLELPNLPGLSHHLLGQRSAGEVIHPTDMKNFCFVAAGMIPENPVELLNSQRMQDFLADCTRQFDWVIVDAPPVLALADADLLATKVDGVIFVVRPGHTQADMLANSMESLKGKNLLGTVLNSYSDKEISKYSEYYSHESSSS